MSDISRRDLLKTIPSLALPFGSFDAWTKEKRNRFALFSAMLLKSKEEQEILRMRLPLSITVVKLGDHAEWLDSYDGHAWDTSLIVGDKKGKEIRVPYAFTIVMPKNEGLITDDLQSVSVTVDRSELWVTSFSPGPNSDLGMRPATDKSETGIRYDVGILFELVERGGKREIHVKAARITVPYMFAFANGPVDSFIHHWFVK